MIKYILKRIGLMLVTLWFIVTITFFAVGLMPGSPYPNVDKMSAEQIAQQDKINGFDRPIVVQYADYMTGVVGFKGAIKLDKDKSQDLLGFDLGYSFGNQTQVGELITKKYPVSFSLGVAGLIFGTLVGVTLGLVASIKKNSFADYFSTFIAVLGVSFPSFVLAAYSQLYLASKLGLFPVIYQKGNTMSVVLPIISLSVFVIAQVARVTRTEMVEILGNNYINLARAKGVKRSTLIFKHAFRNSLVSVLTILGPMMVSLTTGSLVVERIFGIPGMGDLLVNGVLRKDTYVVVGVVLFISLQILVTYLVVDLLYALVDPRIRVAGGKK